MLKTYDEMYKNLLMSKERALWEIARELSRKNDLLEVEMLCKTAEAIRAAAKGSNSGLYDTGWEMAEELALMAHKKITTITGLSDALHEGEDKDE
jgi:hypothetical protein